MSICSSFKVYIQKTMKHTNRPNINIDGMKRLTIQEGNQLFSVNDFPKNKKQVFLSSLSLSKNP